MAPPLAGSPWVRDSDGWLIRIALHGVQGPIEVAGERWDKWMPGHAADPDLDDETLAGLLTFVRRAWGQRGAAIEPGQVAEVRARSAGRRRLWTVEELLREPVDHVLDRFAGSYRLRALTMSLRVRRQADQLLVAVPGQDEGPLVPDGEGGYRSLGGPPGTRFVFEQDGRGKVSGVTIHLENGQTARFRKVE